MKQHMLLAEQHLMLQSDCPTLPNIYISIALPSFDRHLLILLGCQANCLMFVCSATCNGPQERQCGLQICGL